MPYSVSLFIRKKFRGLCNHTLWAYLCCNLNHIKMQIGSGFRITLSRAKPPPKLDEGTAAFIKPSLNSLKKMEILHPFWAALQQLHDKDVFSLYPVAVSLASICTCCLLLCSCSSGKNLALISPSTPTHGRQHWGPLFTCSSPGSTSPAFSAYQILIS